MPSPELFFETAFAHQRTAALKAAIDLDVFTAIQEGARTATSLAAFKSRLEDEGRLVAERGPNARRSEITASGDFHLLLSSVAGNVILQRFMKELVARSSLVIALYGRSGISSCGHLEHVGIVDALEHGHAELAGELMLHHIDHIEADLDLRVRSGPALKEALEL